MARILWRPVSAVIKMLIGSVLAAFILGMMLTVETGENVFHIMF